MPLFINAFHILVNNGVGAISGFIFWLLAARLFPSSEVGVAAAGVAAMGYLGLVGVVGLEGGLIRFLPVAAPADKPRLLNVALTGVTLSGIALASAFLLLVDVVAPELGELRRSPVLAALFVVFTTAWTVHTTLIGGYAGLRRTHFVSLQGSTFGVCSLLGIGLMSVVRVPFSVLIGFGIGLVVSTAFSLCVLLPRATDGHPYRPAFHWPTLRPMLAFAIPSHVVTIAWFTPTWLLPILVVSLLGAEANAYFYIAWALARLPNEAAFALSLSFTAEGAHDVNNVRARLLQSLKGGFVVLAGTAAFLVVGADLLLAVFGPAYQAASAPLLRLLAIASLPLLITAHYLGFGRVHHRFSRLIPLTIGMAATTLVGTYLLAPQSGLISIGLVWLAAQVVGGVVSYYQLR